MNADSTLKWSGLESLSGKKIAVRRNFNLGNDWNQIVDTMSLYEINSIEQGFMMLQAKRVEGFAGYDINWDYFLNNSKNFQTSSFKKLPPFGKSEEYVATLKSNPRSEKILTTFDEGFDTICKNGVFETIKAKWLGE